MSVLDFTNGANQQMYYVSCPMCHASGPEKSTPQDAIKIWNSVVQNEKVIFYTNE